MIAEVAARPVRSANAMTDISVFVCTLSYRAYLSLMGGGMQVLLGIIVNKESFGIVYGHLPWQVFFHSYYLLKLFYGHANLRSGCANA